MTLRPRPPLRTAARWCAALLIAAAAGASAQPAASDAKVSRFYEDALVRYEKKDYAGAIIQLKNALQIDRRQLAVQVLMGKALLADGQVAAAEAAFEEALRLGVNRAEVVVPLARSVVGMARQPQLFDQPRFAESGLPPTVRYQLLLVKAGAAADLGDPRGALKAIDEARAIDPAGAESWLAEVPIRSRAGQMREAELAADKVLALQPTSAEALYLRGTVAHVQGRLPEAMGYYDRALRAEPSHTEAPVSRAGLLLDLNRLDDAQRDVAELTKSSATDPRAAYMSALLAERRGKAAEAKAALNRVTGLIDPIPIEFMRYRPQILMLGGLSHFGLGQTEKAKPYLEAVLRHQPGSPVAKLLGRVLIAQGNADSAVEVLESYLRQNPGDGQAVLLIASAHMAQGRHSRATALLQNALQRSTCHSCAARWA